MLILGLVLLVDSSSAPLQLPPKQKRGARGPFHIRDAGAPWALSSTRHLRWACPMNMHQEARQQVSPPNKTGSVSRLALGSRPLFFFVDFFL